MTTRRIVTIAFWVAIAVALVCMVLTYLDAPGSYGGGR